MMNAAEIISSIEEMAKKIQILEKENENLRIEVWNKDKDNTSLKAELDKWKRIASANVTQQK